MEKKVTCPNCGYDVYVPTEDDHTECHGCWETVFVFMDETYLDSDRVNVAVVGFN